MKIIYVITFIYMGLSLNSCVSYESLLNYNESAAIRLTPQVISNFSPITIQPNDILQIRVISNNASTVSPFNLSGGGEQNQGGSSQDNYLVDSKGNIEFPTLGTVFVKDLAIEAIKDTLLQLLSPYFEKNPILQVNITNFHVNVNGEVNSPGTFTINNDRLSVLEAVTRAGDFTTYSRRDSILIIREKDGVWSFGYVNFNSSEIFNSPYFYLQQNDVVYVQPEKTKVNSVRDPSSRFLPWVSALVSVSVLIITIVR